MRMCRGCAEEIDPQHKFCLRCGTPVDAAPIELRGARYMPLKYAGRCASCETSLEQRMFAWWNRADRTVTCHTCMVLLDARASRIDAFGEAGRSAAKTAERRRANDRAEYDQLSRLRKLVKGRGPDRGLSWEKGAAGEHKVGVMLDTLAHEGVIARLHDVGVPGTSANIDHVAIAASGVYIIDAKRYSGAVEIRIRHRQRELWVNGRNRMTLVDKLAKQVLVVDREIGSMTGETVVTPVLCFVDSQWKVRGKNRALNGVRITYRRELEKALRAPGPLDRSQIFWIAEHLATRLRPA